MPQRSRTCSRRRLNGVDAAIEHLFLVCVGREVGANEREARMTQHEERVASVCGLTCIDAGQCLSVLLHGLERAKNRARRRLIPCVQEKRLEQCWARV